MKNNALSLLLCSSVLLCSCRVENIGRDLSAGLSKNMETIGKNLLAGVNKGLSDSVFQQNLYHLVDSLITTAGASGNRAASNIIDSLTNDRLRQFIKGLIEEATGEKLKSNIVALRGELLGPATAERVRSLLTNAVNSVLNDETNARIAQLRNELLGDATAIQIARLRDSLLSARTATAVKAIVDSALSGASRFLSTDLRQGIDSNVSIIQRYAVRWLLLLAGIAALIIFLVWRNRQKYLKMTTLLAAQIHSIPDQRTYDQITSRIKTKAIETGVEPTLNKVLKENGILGKESWIADQQKKS